MKIVGKTNEGREVTTLAEVLATVGLRLSHLRNEYNLTGEELVIVPQDRTRFGVPAGHWGLTHAGTGLFWCFSSGPQLFSWGEVGTGTRYRGTPKEERYYYALAAGYSVVVFTDDKGCPAGLSVICTC